MKSYLKKNHIGRRVLAFSHGSSSRLDIMDGFQSNFVVEETLPNLSEIKEAWSQSMGFGYSGIVVKGNAVISMGHDGQNKESVFCYDAKSGKELWKFTYPAELIDKMHVGGPNATPLIHDDHVYTLSKDGQLHCLDLASGQLTWKASMNDVFSAEVPIFGYASSPVIYDGQLIISSGKAASIHAKTGKVNWVSKDADKPSYGSPMCFEFNNKHYTLVVTGTGIRALDLKDGRSLSFYEMKSIKSSCVSPIKILSVKNEFIVATNTGTSRIRFESETLKELWRNPAMKNKLTNCVYIDGYLYGLSGSPNSRRTHLGCLDAKDGSLKWSESSYGHGTLLGDKNKILFLSDDGKFITFKANPKAYEEMETKQVIKEICWTTPTYSNGQLYLRNDKGILKSFSLN